MGIRLWQGKTRFVLLGVIALLQLAIPTYLILSQELSRSQGQEVILPVRPVDPYDPLRGRFLILQPILPQGQITDSLQDYLLENESAHVKIITDVSGRPTAMDLALDNDPYIRLDRDTILASDSPTLSPIRYYLQEDLAIGVEELLSRWDSWEQVEMEALILQGELSPTNLIIQGIPLELWNPDAGEAYQ